MIPAKMMTGIEVPIAKIDGKAAPYDELSTMGIRVKKNADKSKSNQNE